MSSKSDFDAEVRGLLRTFFLRRPANFPPPLTVEIGIKPIGALEI